MSFKIILIGDGGVGKTTFLKRNLTAVFEKKYVATSGVDVHPLSYNTSSGPICFNVWDCAGQERLGGLRDGYFIQADAAILMFDRTNVKTYQSMAVWYMEFRRVCSTAPVIVLGNKCDIKHLAVKSKDIKSQVNLPYYDVSAKSNLNFEKPWLHLARTLMANQCLQFTHATPPAATKAFISS